MFNIRDWFPVSVYQLYLEFRIAGARINIFVEKKINTQNISKTWVWCNTGPTFLEI
jgi:hypothetical protein